MYQGTILKVQVSKRNRCQIRIEREQQKSKIEKGGRMKRKEKGSDWSGFDGKQLEWFL